MRARTQDRLNWLNRLVVCCDCSRSTLASIEEAGFTVTALDRTELPEVPPFVRHAVVGIASRTRSRARSVTGRSARRRRLRVNAFA